MARSRMRIQCKLGIKDGMERERLRVRIKLRGRDHAGIVYVYNKRECGGRF